jgi:hypothetical protein
MRQQAEEFLAAWVAAIGRKTKKALQDYEGALRDAFAGHVLKIEITATRAVNVMHKGNGNSPGVEPKLAGLASPRTQANQRAEKISYATAMRTKAIATPASRANHLAGLSPVTAAQHIQNIPRRQEPRHGKRPGRCKIAGARNANA